MMEQDGGRNYCMSSASFDALLRTLQFDDASAAKAFSLPRELIAAFRNGEATPPPSIVAQTVKLMDGVIELAASISGKIIDANPPLDNNYILVRFRDETQYLASHRDPGPGQSALPFPAYTAALLIVASKLTELGYSVSFEYQSEEGMPQVAGDHLDGHASDQIDHRLLTVSVSSLYH